MRLRKLVSGGQTGVDRAALDVAIELGIPCGGWCPKGRFAEDGAIPACYPLRETPLDEYAQRTEWNVRDSDATLIITWGAPAGGTAFTADMAAKWKKPCCVVNLDEPVEMARTCEWIGTVRARVLNVAGPRASRGPQIYPEARQFLLTLLSEE
jgi:hypothetical protein